MSPPRSQCHLFSSMLRASLFGKASPLAQRVTDGRVARGRECPVPTHSKKTCETCDRICSPSCDLEQPDHICDDAGAHWESSAGSQALQFDSNIFLILYVVINSWCQFFRFVKIDYWLWLSYGWFGWLTNRQDWKLKLKTAKVHPVHGAKVQNMAEWRRTRKFACSEICCGREAWGSWMTDWIGSRSQFTAKF